MSPQINGVKKNGTVCKRKRHGRTVERYEFCRRKKGNKTIANSIGLPKI